MRKTIEETVAEHVAVGAPPTWVLSNHDVARHVSRYARLTQVAGRHVTDAPASLELGLRRARAAILLTLALPGGAYLYQGEELGLPEVEDLPDDVLQDPTWERSGHTARGRDGCRVPLPWSGATPPYGFTTGPTTWLPQPPNWGPLSVEAQTGDPASMLELYRTALHLRRTTEALGDGSFRFRESPDPDVLAFDRDPAFTCVVNFGTTPAPLPEHRSIALSSVPLTPDGLLPDNAAVWLVR